MLWVALGVAVLLVVITGTAVLAGRTGTARITASSTAFGFDAESLAVGSQDDVGWRSADTDDSPAVTYRLVHARTLNRIDVAAPSGGSLLSAGHVEFADGSAVRFRARPSARTFTIRFTTRSTSRFRLVADSLASGAAHVQYSKLQASLDESGIVEAGRPPDRIVATSSLGAAPRVSARGDLDGWAPEAGDVNPSVRLSWRTPQEVYVVTALAQAGATDFRAQVRFSDGSSVPLGVVTESKPSTTAFMARVTTSVTISAVQGRLSLSRFSVSPGGESASSPAPRSTASPPAAAPCEDRVAASTTQSLAILCPTPGTPVTGGRFSVRARSSPNATVTASAWVPGLQVVEQVASATSDGSGLVDLPIDASDLLHGPLNVLVSVTGGAGAVVQVVNDGGVADRERDPAPRGLRKVYEDQFDGPVSVSEVGRATRYAALKPSADGATQFGDAPFSDPAADPDQIAAVPDGYLRLQLSPVQDTSGARKLQGAMVSSYSATGSGFSALDGYFEARILGGPGPGAWPAFWLLSADSAYQPRSPVSEVDVVELYGHDRRTGCHSTHNYTANKPDFDRIDCSALASPADDWALQWHTYGVRVTAHEAVFSVDGITVSRGPRSTASEQPMFFMLNLAAGGGWPVDLSATSDTSQMYVDWVRVKV